MDIETIREHKKTVEREIFLMLVRLQKETGARITGVDFVKYSAQMMGQDPDKTIEQHCYFTIQMEI